MHTHTHTFTYTHAHTHTHAYTHAHMLHERMHVRSWARCHHIRHLPAPLPYQHHPHPVLQLQCCPPSQHHLAPRGLPPGPQRPPGYYHLHNFPFRADAWWPRARRGRDLHLQCYQRGWQLQRQHRSYCARSDLSPVCDCPLLTVILVSWVSGFTRHDACVTCKRVEVSNDRK